MNNLIPNSEDNSGGLYEIKFVPVIDVESIPEATDDYVIETAVILKEDKMWYRAGVTVDANNFSVECNPSDNGYEHNAKVSGFLAGESSLLAKNMEEMSQYEEYIIIVTDNDGNKRLIGTIDNPVRFTYSSNTQDNFSGRKGYNISFVGNFDFNPYLIDTPIVVYPDDVLGYNDPTNLDQYLEEWLANVALDSLNQEFIDDRVANLLQDTSEIEWVYDDTAGTLTPVLNIDLSDYVPIAGTDPGIPITGDLGFSGGRYLYNNSNDDNYFYLSSTEVKMNALVSGKLSVINMDSTGIGLAHNNGLYSVYLLVTPDGIVQSTAFDAVTLKTNNFTSNHTQYYADIDGEFVMDANIDDYIQEFIDSTGIDVTATGGSDVLYIGTSSADVINIGWSGATINIQGTLLYQNVTNLEVVDKLIRLNKGGSASSGVSSGFEIEEGGSVTGYFATNATRNGWDFKAPAISDYVTLSLASISGGNKTITIPNASGTMALTSDLSSYAALSGATFSGTVVFPAGSVSTPSIQFTGAGTSSGFYSTTTNDLRAATNGSVRMTINNSGVSIPVLTASSSFTSIGNAFFGGVIQVPTSGIIRDANGVTLIQFPSVVSSAVNYFALSNSAATNDLSFGASSASSDTNVNVLYVSKGTSQHRFNNPIALHNGTTYVEAFSGGSTALTLGSGFASMVFSVNTITWSGTVGINNSTGRTDIVNGNSANGFRVNKNTFLNQSSSGYWFSAECSSGITSSSSAQIDGYKFIAVVNNTSGTPTISVFRADPTFTALNSGGKLVALYNTINSAGGSGAGIGYLIYSTGTGALYLEGNILLGGSTPATSATKTLHIYTGTAPSANITDGFTLYSADITAGNAAPFFRTESGDIIKIYAISGWGTPTGTLTRTTYATFSGQTISAIPTQAEVQNIDDHVKILSERLAALISDNKTGHGFLKS